jgi:hypothetical protein
MTENQSNAKSSNCSKLYFAELILVVNNVQETLHTATTHHSLQKPTTYYRAMIPCIALPTYPDAQNSPKLGFQNAIAS